MPDTDAPVIEKWVNYLLKIVGTPNKETYFVGHSIGCQAILRYLEKINSPVGGAVFVSGWFNLKNMEDDEVKEIAEPWITTPINLNKVKQVLPKSALIISDNDPYNCYEENVKKFKQLGSEIITLHKAGHITENDGFKELPEIVEKLS